MLIYFSIQYGEFYKHEYLKMPQMAPTQILKDDWDIALKLHDLSLDKTKLLKVRAMAMSAAADATSFHPSNAPGTFAYQQGTFGLRNEFVGGEWVVDRTDGVEGIRNDARKVKVVYANVDIAAEDFHEPKPRSAKGSGAERLCAGNGWFDTPSYYPPSANVAEKSGWAVYYLMVAPNGAAELSRPVIQGGTFKYYVERFYLSHGDDFDTQADQTFEANDIIDDFDPVVIRK